MMANDFLNEIMSSIIIKNKKGENIIINNVWMYEVSQSLLLEDFFRLQNNKNKNYLQ